MEEHIFLQNGCRFIRSGRRFAYVESVSPRRAVHFSGLDAKFRRESASRISAPSGRNAQLVPAICANYAGADSDAILVRILTAEIFLRTFVLYPRKWLAFFFYILLYRFLQRRSSIEFSASSYLRFSETSFCRKPTRAGILRRVVAVVLSVSLLATKTPVLRRFHCVGHDTERPREHRLSTDAFSSFL